MIKVEMCEFHRVSWIDNKIGFECSIYSFYNIPSFICDLLHLFSAPVDGSSFDVYNNLLWG